jgi:hypothetical protein
MEKGRKNPGLMPRMVEEVGSHPARGRGIVPSGVNRVALDSGTRIVRDLVFMFSCLVFDNQPSLSGAGWERP